MEYLILDEGHSTLTRGTLRTPPTASVLEFEIPEADVPLLDGHVDLQFIGFDQDAPSFEGKVTRRRGNRMAVVAGGPMSDNPMDHLQVPFPTDTFLYPVSGTWQGRSEVHTENLSCGAVSFRSKRPLTMAEIVELAISTRDGAYLIQAKVVSQSKTEAGHVEYVAKFISGVDDIERSVRREILYLQLRERDDARSGKKRKELFRIS